MSKLVSLTDRKLPKSEVHYTDKGKAEHCSICEHYMNKTTCKIVAGEINHNGWCNRFKNINA